MKQIKLTQGIHTLIDDEDYLLVSQHKWHAQRIGKWHLYAATGPSKKTGGKILKMHRLIMDAQPGQEVDHKEHYEHYIDNCKSNLRLCSHAENQCNLRKQFRETTSQYKGVSLDDHAGKWVAYIGVNGKQIHLGLFASEIDAARAYNEAAIQYFGEFANLNNV